MPNREMIPKPILKQAKHFNGFILAALLAISSVIIGYVDMAQSATLPAPDGVEALALKWFAQMQAGQIDRAQLTPDYSAQLTKDAVRDMSNYLKEHDYGVPPKRAEIVQCRTSTDQTLYVVKLVFPRGDAASLLFGFNAQGKITGISLLSMAGD